MSRTTDKPRRASTPAEPAEGVLRRWSRRKHEARATAVRAADSDDNRAPAASRAESPAEPEKVLTDADMPPIETLDEHSDYSMFMSPGVSDTLRQTALRRLFQAPAFNQLCELEGEFFDAHGFEPLGSVVTHEMRAAIERELADAGSRARENMSRRLTEIENPKTTQQAPEALSDASPAVEDLSEIASSAPDANAARGKGDA